MIRAARRACSGSQRGPADVWEGGGAGARDVRTRRCATLLEGAVAPRTACYSTGGFSGKFFRKSA